MRNAPARARANDSPLPLRLVTASESEATNDIQAKQTPADVALAVWRLERATRNTRLPSELALRAIAHYSDPDDLVLAPRRGDALKQAARLGRRALPLHPRARELRDDASRETVGPAHSIVAVRANDRADLILAPIPANAPEWRVSTIVASVLMLLKPGGFLALALTAPRRNETSSHNRGAIVRACQEGGLRYWQHVVALDPGDSAGANCSDTTLRRGRASDNRRASRCHRDLLVFRRPTPGAAAAAAAETRVAA